LQSYRLFIELTSATILDFKGSRPKTEVESRRSPNSCDSANAYTSLAPATEVEGTPRTDTDKLRQQPRTRHRTKLGTQWDRSGLRPTWGHFLSRSVETPESVITTIAFQQGGTAKNELHCQYRKTDRLGSQRPSNPGHPREPTFLRHFVSRNLTSRSFQFGKCCFQTLNR
jgi:hypothetical protein